MKTPFPILTTGIRAATLAAALVCAGAFACAGAGCSAGSYQRSADLDVKKLVEDRQRKTLDYTPQVEAEPTVPQRPAKQAYAKIPTTAFPPPMPAPVKAAEAEVPYGPLGPVKYFDAAVRLPTPAKYGMQGEIDPLSFGLRLGPPAPGPEPIALDLFAALNYAVDHSRDYQDRMEDLYLVALQITTARHLFAPRPFARTSFRYSGGQENVDYRAALTVANSVGVRQQLPYGGEVVAEALVDFVDAVRGSAENAEEASVALSASIPLLRGAGMVNLEPLIQAERSLVYEVREFEDFRRQFAVNVASDYFDLLSQQQQIANALQNLTNSEGLAERTRALYAAGLSRFVDVQRAEQTLLRAENTLIRSQTTYRNNVDDFKLQLGMPLRQPLEIVPRQLLVDIPDVANEDAVQLARSYRLDLQTASDRVEDAQRVAQVAKNGLLPDLDIVATGAVGNNEDEPARRLHNDTGTYSAGIELDLPVDRVIERNAYRRALIQLERAQRQYSLSYDRVAAEALEALRGTRSARTQVRIQENAVALALRRVDNTNELLRQGTGSTEDVVDAQDDLLDAQNELEEARAGLQTQVLQYLRNTGTLRVDPEAGALGRALARSDAAADIPPGPLNAETAPR